MDLTIAIVQSISVEEHYFSYACVHALFSVIFPMHVCMLYFLLYLRLLVHHCALTKNGLCVWNAIVDKNPIFSMHIHIYIYIVQFLIFNSTLNCPIQQTKFLFNICFNSQLFNSLVQILFQYSLQLSIVQLTSSYSFPVFTSTLNCSTH